MDFMCVLSPYSHDLLFSTPWTVAHQVPLSVGFSTQEHWSGLPYPPPGDLPDLGIEPKSLGSPALVGGFFLYHLHHLGSPWIVHVRSNLRTLL